MLVEFVLCDQMLQKERGRESERVNRNKPKETHQLTLRVWK